jgi:8-oxo-dGTP pyrophosphatase MutT (NUDIX family)
MREAAVMLIIRNGLILGISRRDNPNKFGLPGGKKEPDETHMQAAIRETLEETSVVVKSCVKVFERVEEPITPDGLPFYTYCYYATDWEGTPKNSEEGIVEWLFASELTRTIEEGGKGAFADYNKQTLAAFRKQFPDVVILSINV